METIAKQIMELELKEMDGSLLAFSILNFVKNIPSIDSDKVEEAIQLASYLHRHQTRANRGKLPRDTYITHPLRNTLRLLKYGCLNQNVIIASILHDTVEDQAKEIVTIFAQGTVSDELTNMEIALSYIEFRFGKEVARIVRGVSNLPVSKNFSKEEKRKIYAEHVLSAIDDPQIFLVKFSDFVDNAVGLYHNTGSPDMVRHLSLKYIQLVHAFRIRLKTNPELFNLNKQGLEEMKRHLDMGEGRLKKLLISA